MLDAGLVRRPAIRQARVRSQPGTTSKGQLSAGDYYFPDAKEPAAQESYHVRYQNND